MHITQLSLNLEYSVVGKNALVAYMCSKCCRIP